MKFKLIILYFVTVVKSVPLRVEEIKNERLQNLSTLSLPSNATSIRADITDNFSCNNKSYGYYADIENDCQIFHVCLPVQYSDSKERIFRWSFICPDETVFSQQSFTCVRSEDLTSDCSESEKYYDLNKNFGISSSEEENSEENYKGVNTMASSKKPLQQQQFVQEEQQQQQQQEQQQQQQRFTTITTAPSLLKENVEEYDESDKTITAKTISIPDIELITATSIKQRIEISPTESNLYAIVAATNNNDIEHSETINDNDNNNNNIDNKKVNADDLSVEQAVNVAHLLAAAVPTTANEIDPINDNKNENENNDISLNTRELISNNKLQNDFSNDNQAQAITTTITDENHDISTYRPTATNPTNYVKSLNAYLINDAIEEPYQEKVNLPFKINIISENNDDDINDINDQIINDDDNNNNNNNNEIETKINVMLPQPFSLPVDDDSFGKKLTTTTTLTTDDELSNLIKDINSQAIIDTKHSIGVRSLKNHRNLRRNEFLFKADAIARH